MADAPGTHDAIIIGGGHNGLTCAGYLAKAGLSVAVVERRPVVGGACVTEEVIPGFRNSSCSYLVGLLAPEVLRDLELRKHGLEILERPGGVHAPLPDGDAFELAGDPTEVRASLARRHPADAEAYETLTAQLEPIAQVVRRIARRTPPEIDGGWGALMGALPVARDMTLLPRDLRAVFADLMLKSLGDFLDARFHDAAFKGVYGFKGLVGNMVSPYAAGSAYVILHHVFGELDGQRGKWGQPRGGMGAITQAMARFLESKGTLIRTGSGVREVITDGGRASGVVLEDGTTLRAPRVVSAINPRLLFLKLLDRALLPAETIRRMESWRCRSGTFRMNVALSELPRFSGKEGDGIQRYHTGTIAISPSLSYLERAYQDAVNTGMAREPIISICLPTTLDDGLAPEGCHIASLFCQHFNNRLPDGRSWHDARDEAASLILRTIGRYSPNFESAVIGHSALSPLDLEEEYGLVGGDIFHGEMHLDQLFSMRPGPGMADYRTPVKGLYQCGSGVHPGGGVTGIPGMNAAREILRDARRRTAA